MPLTPHSTTYRSYCRLQSCLELSARRPSAHSIGGTDSAEATSPDSFLVLSVMLAKAAMQPLDWVRIGVSPAWLTGFDSGYSANSHRRGSTTSPMPK